MAACMINSINRCSSRRIYCDTEAPKVCIAKLVRWSTFRALPSSSESHLNRLGLRPWSSVSTAYEKIRPLKSAERPHVSQDGRSDEASFEVLGKGRGSSTNEDRDDSIQNIASAQENASQEASAVSGGSPGVGLEDEYIEGRGDDLELVVNNTRVPKLSSASKKSASSVASVQMFGEDNLSLLIALGANEEQRALILKRHPEFGGPQAPPFLMESVRLFEEFGIESHMLMHVIQKLNRVRRYNIFLHTPPHKPKLVLTFLRDKIGVKNLERVVKSSPTLLGLSLETLEESVKNLESLGVVVDGDFVESYHRLLTYAPTAMKDKAKALEMALSPRCFLKYPILLGVKADNVEKRVANLQAILGEDVTKEFLSKVPNILMSREASVKEMYRNLSEMIPSSELLARIRCWPIILGLNWKTLNSKFQYLGSEGFTKGEILSNLSVVSGRSLDKFIKPRVEQAISCRTQEDCFDLNKILCQSQALFEKRFGVT